MKFSTSHYDGLRMLFGILILIVLAVLATLIASGKVEEKESFGLMPIVTSLATLAGAFAQWAFRGQPETPSSVETPPPETPAAAEDDPSRLAE